ncbi:MAG: hypothetical protein GY722_11435 [bacterium]|nr:hypothetical protein [bacterium]
MRYEGTIYRPPSEARSYILQATVGCSWNHCTYCDMYRDKTFRVRDLDATLADVRAAGRALGPDVRKVFVADGDALVMDLEHGWVAGSPASEFSGEATGLAAPSERTSDRLNGRLLKEEAG